MVRFVHRLESTPYLVSIPMKSHFRHLIAGFSAAALLVAPLSGHAATMPAITQAQKSAAASQLQQALKTAGASSLAKATPRQVNAAIAGVLSKNRNSKNFLGALTEVLVQGRPDLTIDIVKTMTAAVTPPGECPPAGAVEAIIMAAVKSNPAADQAIVAAAVRQAPCQAAAITAAAVSANPTDAAGIVKSAVANSPSSATASIISAALSVSPASAGASIVQVGNATGSGNSLSDLSGLLNIPGGFGASSNNSAGTLNPANINGNGNGSTPVVPTNSTENLTGG